jgi:hypothetical protein
MIPVDAAIARFRRDLVVSNLLRVGLFAVAFVSLFGAPWLGFHGEGVIALVVVSLIWMTLSYRSLQGSRLAADSPALIATGQFDRAESIIETGLRSFSLFRTAKLLSLHHLALLRHAQQRWRETSLLCQALVRQKMRGLPGLARSTRLLLADSLLQMGEVRGAYEAMAGLQGVALSLHESLTLQLLQLDYCSRVNGWDAMLDSVRLKVQMSELMPTVNAARSQAYLALAAQKKGRYELAQWLRRRAELLAPVDEIAAQRPLLAALFRENW